MQEIVKKLLKVFYIHKKKFLLVFCCFLVLLGLWIGKYTLILCFFGVPLDIHKELTSYIRLGSQRVYLVALMNTSERKPDGGFFGSYLIVRLGSGKFIQAYDSYYPQVVANVRVPLPEWFYPVMKIRDVGFLGANMVGFTNIDGKNIVDIYRKTFHEKLDGVVFLKYDMFKYLIDNFDELSWKWEFENACIDLIRGFQTGNKKELYFKQLQQYFSWRKLISLGRRLLLHWDTIRENGFVRIYLPNGSPRLQEWLVQKNLITLPLPQYGYFYDYNLGFNKIDKFVRKTVFFDLEQDLRNQGNQKGDRWERKKKGEDMSVFKKDTNVFKKNKQTENSEKKGNSQMFYQSSERILFPTHSWTTGSIYLEYILDIPSSYIEYIEKLRETYRITLTEREKIILSLLPQIRNRGVVYLPKGIDVIAIGGDGIDVEQFTTPFGLGIKYDILGKGSDIQKRVWIKVKKSGK